MATPSTDPAGWVTNPPQTVVKIHGLASRAVLNDQLAVVLGYQSDRARYICHVIMTQEQVSLKQENLKAATFVEKMQGQYQMIRYDPNAQRQLREAYDKVARKLPANIKPEHAMGGILLFLIAIIYSLGLSKTFLLLSLLLTVAVVIGPDIVAGADVKTVLRNAPNRTRDAIRTHIPYVGETIANNSLLTAATVALWAVYMGQGLLRPRNSRRNISNNDIMPPLTVATTSSNTAQQLSVLKEKFYKLGFEDALQGKEFGVALASALAVEDAMPERDLLETPASSNFDFSGNMGGSSGRKGFGVSTAISLVVLVRTIHALGAQPGGRGWNFQQAKQNLLTLEPWKMAMLAVSFYSVTSPLLSMVFSSSSPPSF